MKIATVTPYDLAVPGGVNTHVLQMAQWLRGQGHEVRVIGPGRAAGAPAGVTLVGETHGVPAGGSVARIALSWRLSGAVQSLLAAEQFDVVHLHEPLMPLLPWQFLRHSRALNVGAFHAAAPLGPPLSRLAAPVLARWAARLHARIAVSGTARTAAARYLADGCEIIPNGVDLNHFQTPVPPPPVMRGDRRTVLFVGRQEPRKGLAVLLDAYGEIRAARPDTQLVVVGPASGPGRRLAARARQRGWTDVVFMGAAPPADLPAYYQHADVFCSPAIGGESFGMVLTEAMAAGAPVVASDIPGYRDVVRSGVDGLLVPPRRADALATAVLALLDNAPRRRALAERGRERARTFSIDTVGRSVLALYDQALARRRTGAA